MISVDICLHFLKHNKMKLCSELFFKRNNLSFSAHIIPATHNYECYKNLWILDPKYLT